MADVEHWERWISWRLTAQPDYKWTVANWDAISTSQEQMEATVSVQFASATSHLIEMMAEMAPRATLPRLSEFLRADYSAMSRLRAELLERAQWVITARDGGRSIATPARQLSAADAAAEVAASHVLILFLSRLADPAGLTALVRMMHSGAGDSTLNQLYLTLIQFKAWENSLPPAIILETQEFVLSLGH